MADNLDLVAKSVVFVGDEAVGKTSLLNAYRKQSKFRTSYVPTM